MLGEQYRRGFNNDANNLLSSNNRGTHMQYSNAEISGLSPTFDGSSQNIELWIERVDAVQAVYGVPNTIMQLLTVGKLEGRAKEWYISKVILS